MSNNRRWFALSLVAGLVACGGQSETGGTGGAAGAGGASASGGGGTGAVSGGGGSGAVDGGTGGTVAGGGGVGASGGAPGGGGAPCASLEQGYVETLKKAKVCNPMIDMEQCTKKVPDALACPCGGTFVNAGAAEALKTLGDLKYFWDTQKCGEGIGCPAIACEEPAGAGCDADPAGSSGTCQDMYLNGGGG
ncbi:MAG: hypothetical protein IPI67_29975 [Myxococcales bacterium]|nr:hypothetical protein [Myxococcales bacterium]